ncbi:Stealth CR1 domain-containing protein [Massilia antarctica]|uniref:Stealth CR1 domain-containing protein n=1 Tax=Massilia antarctica TaxID=2765360 RepID=UPI001E2FE463|nr:Stealth CR1 domain-containing protein [Massilia antarctica]
MEENIDIVYLWVDGSDPLWRAKRRAARAGQGGTQHLARHGDVEGRYRDNGELRFNLRALQTFFPGHGHVYLVTDDQVPHWLVPGDRLTVISHRALMPPAALPVFDSSHIESYLHHIPGLAERFIYLNDDVFFGCAVDPQAWFGADGVAVYADVAAMADYEAVQAHQSAPVNASVLSRQWLSQRYPQYRHDGRALAHAPRPMLKSRMHELERVAPQLFAKARQTIFRSWHAPSIVADLLPRWLIHTGHAVWRDVQPRYVSTGDSDAAQQFEELIGEFGRIPFFCINDTSDDAHPGAASLRGVAQVLAKLLPNPCRFELGGDGLADLAAAA